MEQQHKKPAANTAASSPPSSGSSFSSRSIHGSMSSAFLGVSSSTHSQSQLRRSSPSLYPPPAPLPSHLASRGSAAASGGSAAGSSSSSQFHQISPSPGAVAKRRPRPSSRITHSLPSPFLSELSSIRRMGANVFGDLNAQEIMTQRPLLHGQQEQEMTRSSSSLTMPIPCGEFSDFPSASPLTMRRLRGFAPPPLQLRQQPAQPAFSSLQPLPGGNFSGFPLPESQPQQMQMQPSSSTDLPTIIFQSSSSCSADHAHPSSSDSELPPLPPSLEIRQYGLPLLGQLAQNNGSSFTESSCSTGFVQPSETYELAPLPESLQIPPLLLQQIKQEPVVVSPCLEPEIISLDDGDVDELSVRVHSFASSHGHGSVSLPYPRHEQPTNIELEGMHRLQLGGSGSELSMRGAADGIGQTWEIMPTPASVHDKVNNVGGSRNSIPWSSHGSMPMYSLSEEQALQQLSDLLSLWSSTASSSCDQSMGSSVAGSWSDMQGLANKFDMMSIGGSSSSARPQMLPRNYSSLSVENSTPVPVPKLIHGGMDRPGLPPQSPALGAGASISMSRREGIKEHYFSEADMERIHKDNRLKELVLTDSKRVKRILRNREYAARLKVQMANHLQDLQRRADALKMECSSLSAQVQSRQVVIVNLKTGNRQMQIKLKGLREQDNLSQDLNDQLQSEVQRLKHLGLNMFCANGLPMECQWSASSSANALHQLQDSHANDLISSHQVQTQEHTALLQLEQQPHPVDGKLMGQQQPWKF